jgi:hypothetical protein
MLASVANVFLKHSARSTKKFGRWRKKIGPKSHLFIEANITGFVNHSCCIMVGIFVKTKLQKRTAVFGPFFDKSGANSALEILPAPHNYIRPFLCFAAEISAH